MLVKINYLSQILDEQVTFHAILPEPRIMKRAQAFCNTRKQANGAIMRRVIVLAVHAQHLVTQLFVALRELEHLGGKRRTDTPHEHVFGIILPQYRLRSVAHAGQDEVVRVDERSIVVVQNPANSHGIPFIHLFHRTRKLQIGANVHDKRPLRPHRPQTTASAATVGAALTPPVDRGWRAARVPPLRGWASVTTP